MARAGGGHRPRCLCPRIRFAGLGLGGVPFPDHARRHGRRFRRRLAAHRDGCGAGGGGALRAHADLRPRGQGGEAGQGRAGDPGPGGGRAPAPGGDAGAGTPAAERRAAGPGAVRPGARLRGAVAAVAAHRSRRLRFPAPVLLRPAGRHRLRHRQGRNRKPGPATGRRLAVRLAQPGRWDDPRLGAGARGLGGLGADHRGADGDPAAGDGRDPRLRARASVVHLGAAHRPRRRLPLRIGAPRPVPGAGPRAALAHPEMGGGGGGPGRGRLHPAVGSDHPQPAGLHHGRGRLPRGDLRPEGDLDAARGHRRHRGPAAAAGEPARRQLPDVVRGGGRSGRRLRCPASGAASPAGRRAARPVPRLCCPGGPDDGGRHRRHRALRRLPFPALRRPQPAGEPGRRAANGDLDHAARGRRLAGDAPRSSRTISRRHRLGRRRRDLDRGRGGGVAGRGPATAGDAALGPRLPDAGRTVALPVARPLALRRRGGPAFRHGQHRAAVAPGPPHRRRRQGDRRAHAERGAGAIANPGSTAGAGELATAGGAQRAVAMGRCCRRRRRPRGNALRPGGVRAPGGRPAGRWR